MSDVQAELQMCPPCAAGFHDRCRGTCEEGERYHPDPDDEFFFNRALTDPFGHLRPTEEGVE